MEVVEWRLREDDTVASELAEALEHDEAGRVIGWHTPDSDVSWTWDADGVLGERRSVHVRLGEWRTTYEGDCPEGVWRDDVHPTTAPGPGPGRAVVRPYGT